MPPVDDGTIDEWPTGTGQEEVPMNGFIALPDSPRKSTYRPDATRKLRLA